MKGATRREAGATLRPPSRPYADGQGTGHMGQHAGPLGGTGGWAGVSTSTEPGHRPSGWAGPSSDLASEQPLHQQRGPRPEHRSQSERAQFPDYPRVWPQAVMKPPPVKGVTDARPGVTGCWRGSLTAGAPLGLEFPLLLWLRASVPGLSPPPGRGLSTSPWLWLLGAQWRGSWRVGSVPVTRAE